MDEEHAGGDVVYRFSWIAGGAAIVLSILRLGRLLRDTESGPPWMLALVAAVVLGAVITWTAVSYRIGLFGVIGANLVGLALSTIRIVAPDTAILGIFPSFETFEAMRQEMGFAYEVIRFGSAPVVPLSGLIVILAVIFWVLGAFLSWGLLKGKPALALLPPFLFYLQLATIDRVPPGSVWMLAVLLLVVGSLLAVGVDERLAANGRLRRAVDSQRVAPVMPMLPASFIVLPVAVAVTAMTLMSSWVPEQGMVNWRSRSGIGGGILPGVSYNLFAGIVQGGLVANSDTEVFRVKVDGDINPRQLYFRLINLERFDGENWIPGPARIERVSEGDDWGNPEQVYAGLTRPVIQEVQIGSLRQNYLPALPMPYGLSSGWPILQDSFRVREDGSIKFDLRSFEGLSYTVVSDYALPNYGALATTTNGELSPIFQEASANGVFNGRARPNPGISRPEDIDDFLELPDDIDDRVAVLARAITQEGNTPFERSSLLEAYFHDTVSDDGFTYDASIVAGHGASELADWLLDPSSPSYRTGYCEQFATSMAVMARQLGLPSRVVLGFAPGDVQEDGQTIIIREKYAHAWVEIWINGHGWVRFDPTPRGDGQNTPTTLSEFGLGFDPSNQIPEPQETALVEPGDSANPGDIPLQFQIEDGLNVPLVPTAERGGFTISGWLIGLMVALLLSATIPVFKLWRRRRRMSRLNDGDITAAWEEIVDRLTDLGTEVPAHQTPHELALATDETMTDLAGEYGRTVYGPDLRPSETSVVVAKRSFHETENHLRQKHSLTERIWAWVRPRSLGRRR